MSHSITGMHVRQPASRPLKLKRISPKSSHPTGTAYVLIFLGAAPLVIALACLLQLLWLPLAAAIMIVRVSRNRSCAASIILYPLTAAALVLNINGE